MKSIFHRFATIYLLVFLVAYACIIVGVRFYLEQYFIRQTHSEVLARVNALEVAADQNGLDLPRFFEQIEMLEDFSEGATIWIVDEDGNARVSDLAFVHHGDDGIRDSYRRVLDGEIVTSYSSDKMVLRTGVPIRFGDKVFAIFTDTSMELHERAIFNVLVLVFLAIIVSLLIALAFLYSVTSKISGEVRLITAAAAEISSGEYDGKIITDSSWELGDLAVAFNKMADDIAKLDTARKNFVASFSHDIRTPLTTIKGYTTGILDGTIDREKQDKYLNIVVSECDRMLKMSNSLLDLSKIESGELVFAKTDFDLNSLILGVFDSFEQKVKEKQVKVELDLSNDDVLAHGDFSAIQRVVYNLLDNATKFVNPTGKITIKTELKDDKYYIGIGNTGHVLTSAQLVQIWNRFEKLDSSRGLENKSSGLGLPIVKEIMKAHGERIDVYSNEEIGVVFIFTLSAQIFKRKNDGKA